MNNKSIIRDFYQEFFNDHNVDAANRYVHKDYLQHNPGVPQGRAGLMKAFQEKFIQCPDFKLDIKMIIMEDDMVVVYLKNVDPSGDTRCRVVDIYRLKEGMLMEHWDVLQPCNPN